MEKFGAVIVAAGTGSRMGTPVSKQYLPLAGRPILAHTLEAFERLEETELIVLVVGRQDIQRCRELVETYGFSKVRHIATGGENRQESVFNGLTAMPETVRWVLVHDGVRPLVTAERIRQCFRAALQYGAAVLAVPAKDTLKIVDDRGKVLSTPARKSLWAVQTPQAFRLSDLRKAHEEARRQGVTATDDASLVERIGMDVYVVQGDYENLKITTHEDLILAETLLKAREKKGETGK